MIEGQSAVALPKIWSDALTEFTANEIPIHLIDLRTLRLVSRFDVARYYRPILVSYLQKHPSRQNAPQQEVSRSILKFVKYAIFSHRWLTDGEPTIRDIPKLSAFADALINDETLLAQTLAQDVLDTPTRASFHKLLLFCSKARSYRCPFAWSDTCCIDKESSAELDESIRSMFRWYRNSFICIVHLASSLTLDDIPADEWFMRGWTLQELLAPENIKFYNKVWMPLTEARNDNDRRNDARPEGEKNPIWKAILATTRIPSTRFGHFEPGAFDVAQRLSWAAGRRTTRSEDMAYALVGIFGINMPVQYGEGKFAFQRLMEALLQRVRDYQIFVWTGPSSPYTAALPASIEGYLAVRDAEDFNSVPNSHGDPSVMMTHKGLQVEVLLVHMQCREEDDDHRREETSSSEDTERSDQNADIDNDQNSEACSDAGQGDFDTEDGGTDSSDSEDSELGIRFLGNDEDFQSNFQGRFLWFYFTDSSGTFKPFSVRGHGPLVFFDDLLTSPDTQYALGILDYHRDWKRQPGYVYVPYDEKTRYLSFVLYRDDPGEVWCKMQTDTLVYVEVEDEHIYEGETVTICL